MEIEDKRYHLVSAATPYVPQKSSTGWCRAMYASGGRSSMGCHPPQSLLILVVHRYVLVCLFSSKAIISLRSIIADTIIQPFQSTSMMPALAINTIILVLYAQAPCIATQRRKLTNVILLIDTARVSATTMVWGYNHISFPRPSLYRCVLRSVLPDSGTNVLVSSPWKFVHSHITFFTLRFIDLRARTPLPIKEFWELLLHSYEFQE